jgi:hypothetical protein
VAWHDAYRDPASDLSRRLAVVQRRIAESLATAPAGPILAVSACAGDGRDLLEVLPTHPRRDDVRARLVELDPDNAGRARRAAAGLPGVEVVEADAGRSDAYMGAVPADLVLLCGVFGNIADTDVEATIRATPMLCAPGATVIWTRHRRSPDLTPSVRHWFTEFGFDEVAFDGEEGGFGVGVARLAAPPPRFEPRRRLFAFAT